MLDEKKICGLGQELNIISSILKPDEKGLEEACAPGAGAKFLSGIRELDVLN